MPTDQGRITGAFIESVRVPPAALPMPLGEWLHEHPVEVDVMSGAITRHGAVMPVPWPGCDQARCSPGDDWTLTLTPTLPTNALAPTVLRIQLTPPEGSSAQPRDLTINAYNQQPAVVQLGPGASTGGPWLVVTTLLLSGREDMKKLLDCRQAQRSAQQR